MHLTLHTLELIHQDGTSTGRESSYQLFGSVRLRRSLERLSTDLFCNSLHLFREMPTTQLFFPRT
jgi:hypothetical protein